MPDDLTLPRNASKSSTYDSPHGQLSPKLHIDEHKEGEVKPQKLQAAPASYGSPSVSYAGATYG